jgi:hypothetical protein
MYISNTLLKNTKLTKETEITKRTKKKGCC